MIYIAEIQLLEARSKASLIKVVPFTNYIEKGRSKSKWKTAKLILKK